MFLHDPRDFVVRFNLRLPNAKIACVDGNDPPVDLSGFDFVIYHYMEHVLQPFVEFQSCCHSAYNNDRMFFVVGGFNGTDLNSLPNNWLIHPFWIDQVVHFNQTRPSSANILTKPYRFDALLGKSKSHRKFVYEQVQAHAKAECFLMNIDLPDYFSQAVFDLETPEMQKIKQAGWPRDGFDSTLRLSTTASISQTIPAAIFDESWYSIVCETDENRFFITEKTAKPLVDQRVFVPFACLGFMRNLKSLGFLTFDQVLDESYDLEPVRLRRYQKAWQQIEYLLVADPIYVTEVTQDVRVHNAYLCRNTQYWADRLQKFLDKLL